MRPVPFDESIQKGDIHILRSGRVNISCWSLSWKELFKLIFQRKIYLYQKDDGYTLDTELIQNP